MTSRGVIISPGFRSSGPGSFSVNADDATRVLRQCLLYWDRIEWPDNNLVSIGNDPEVDFLTSAGVLQRTRIVFAGAFTGDLTPVLAEGQLRIFEHLERLEPGAWSIAQASDVLRFPGQNVAVQRALEVQLYESLPIPSDTVPFQDILEFRERYADELQTFRSVLDEMYGEILGAPDPARMRSIIAGKLANTLRDIENAMHGRALANWRGTVSVEIKMPEVAVQAVGVAAWASVLGMPWEIGAALGAAASAVRLQFAPVPMPVSARPGAFAYLYHAKRELTK